MELHRGRLGKKCAPNRGSRFGCNFQQEDSIPKSLNYRDLSIGKTPHGIGGIGGISVGV